MLGVIERRSTTDQPADLALRFWRHRPTRGDTAENRLTDTTTTDYLTLLAGTEHVRGDLAPRHLAGAAEADDRSRVATAVPYVAADVARRLQIGDALLVHGHLPATWVPAAPRAV